MNSFKQYRRKQIAELRDVGEMSTRETSTAITKLDEALMWINKRSEAERSTKHL